MPNGQQTTQPIEIIVTESIRCPHCGAVECCDDPTSPTGKRFHINAYKVADRHGYWWSRCNVCKTWF
ncbi:hypothetical protein DFR49_0977 [Hephaestia caeni]|uniref:Uncharacterized protein n=1 Tax=Hephaestia caeni TaxID=645617 RepID=A0A397PGQ2_9SPHN|nr:hypothetical protein [Hephaestia caeni]RIA46435.1 hypothetical protein DFR49_0977 [Hephaestia caeni]